MSGWVQGDLGDEEAVCVLRAVATVAGGPVDGDFEYRAKVVVEVPASVEVSRLDSGYGLLRAFEVQNRVAPVACVRIAVGHVDKGDMGVVVEGEDQPACCASWRVGDRAVVDRADVNSDDAMSYDELAEAPDVLGHSAVVHADLHIGLVVY